MLQNILKSFWMAGFECADHLNAEGNRVDMLAITGHLDNVAEDYERLHSVNIITVREGICWSQVEKRPYEYDFTVVKSMLKAGETANIQQIWDICHFGFPDDLHPLHPLFTPRFVSLCVAFAKFYTAQRPGRELIVTPINEVSFLSWLSGEVGNTTPYCKNNGWNVKYALMRAYIQGIRAMKAISPQIRILTTEPIVNIVPPLNASQEEVLQAHRVNEEQYQTLDMLMGTICPELGGSSDLVDVLGFNFYYNNQWVLGFEEFLPWLNESNDPRWRPLSDLIADAHARYNKPIVLSETSHPGEHRANWIEFITGETLKVLKSGIPFWGICLYPIIDRPDWDNLKYWHHSGLWDQQLPDNTLNLRILDEPYAQSLKRCQGIINNVLRQQTQSFCNILR
ncbi:amine oxidase [Mucilaginibacter sp. HD30]